MDEIWLTPDRVFGPMIVDQLDDYELKYWSRLRAILATALENAPADDLLDRQRQIERTGFLGWVVWPGLAAHEYHIGGRLLARVPLDVFSEDAFLEPVAIEAVTIRPGDEVTRGPATS